MVAAPTGLLDHPPVILIPVAWLGKLKFMASTKGSHKGAGLRMYRSDAGQIHICKFAVPIPQNLALPSHMHTIPFPILQFKLHFAMDLKSQRGGQMSGI